MPRLFWPPYARRHQQGRRPEEAILPLCRGLSTTAALRRSRRKASQRCKAAFRSSSMARLSTPLERASIRLSMMCKSRKPDWRHSPVEGPFGSACKLRAPDRDGTPSVLLKDLIAVVRVPTKPLQFAGQWCRAPPEANTVIRALHKWRPSLEPTSRQARSDLESEFRKSAITAIRQQLPQFPHGGRQRATLSSRQLLRARSKS
jgi:hypothetical protein